MPFRFAGTLFGVVRSRELTAVPLRRFRVLLVGSVLVRTAELPATAMRFRDDGAAVGACWGTFTARSVVLLSAGSMYGCGEVANA